MQEFIKYINVMEDPPVSVNGVKDVNGSSKAAYYELDRECDADSSTTPERNIDDPRDSQYIYIFKKKHCIILSPLEENRSRARVEKKVLF